MDDYIKNVSDNILVQSTQVPNDSPLEIIEQIDRHFTEENLYTPTAKIIVRKFKLFKNKV